MRLVELGFELVSHGNDGPLIQNRMRRVVMHFYHLHLGHILDGGHLVDITETIHDRRCMSDTARICLEIDNVDFVETKECHVEAQVGFGKAATGNKALLLQNLIDAVKRLGQLGNRQIIRCLRLGKATTVDSVIYRRVYPLIHRIDTLSHALWIQVQVGVGSKGVEL